MEGCVPGSGDHNLNARLGSLVRLPLKQRVFDNFQQNL